MKIAIDISREYALVLLDHVIEDAECCDEPAERTECEAVASVIRSALYPITGGVGIRSSLLKDLPPIGMAWPQDKPF